MSSGLYNITTRATGTVLTAAIYNADHQNHVDNAEPTMIGAYSDTQSQMRNQEDPGESGSESLAGSLAEELTRLRFALAEMKGTTYWYESATLLAAANNLTDVANAATAFANIKQDATESVTGVVDLATDAEIRSSASGGHALTAEDLDTAAEPVALTDAATVAVDWGSGINFTLEITADRVLGNPTNEIPGQWRTIEVVGDDATDRTLTFDTEYEVVPTLTDIDSTNSYLIHIRCMAASRFRAYADTGGDPT